MRGRVVGPMVVRAGIHLTPGRAASAVACLRRAHPYKATALAAGLRNWICKRPLIIRRPTYTSSRIDQTLSHLPHGH